MTDAKEVADVSVKVVNDAPATDTDALTTISNDEQSDPLLIEDKERLAIFPIVHQDIWAQYKKHESMVWHAHEVELDKDLKDWNNLTEDERFFMKRILAFFASSDVIVADNLAGRFINDVGCLEAKFYYAFQIAMENIHSEVYSKMIDTYISDENEKKFLFNAVRTLSCVAKLANWAKKWIESVSSYAERLIAFICVEGIFFSGPFCSIYWLVESGRMPGLQIGNDFISRDEGLHTDFACLMYGKLKTKVDKARVMSIMKEATEIEKEFIIDALPCKLLGMNSELMVEYIKYVANRLYKQLGYADELYENTKQPFPFMDRLGLNSKKNFFEHRPTEYSKGSFTDTSGKDIYADL